MNIQLKSLLRRNTSKYTLVYFNPGLALPWVKIYPAVLLVYYSTSVYFKMSEKKTPIDPDKISEEILSGLYTQAVGKFALNFKLTF